MISDNVHPFFELMMALSANNSKYRLQFIHHHDSMKHAHASHIDVLCFLQLKYKLGTT